MCGILGYTHNSRKLPEGVLRAGISALIHRGPDQQGSFTSSNVSLGATRLRIVDLEGGDQPMRSADGDAVIAFNGEIFNHHELRAELEALGATFRSHCDTEVVLNAFLEWGTDAFARLRGMFAIAIWVESQRRLVLARDRAGIKPLYYRIQDREVFFGSELKCIFANPDVPRRIDLTGLNCFLSLNYVPGPFTLVEGIQKLMPGCALDWRKGQVAVGSFVPPAEPAPAPHSLDEACEELDGLLTQSVAEQLVSEVPLGMWLSGGLDSSTVLHYASKLSTKRLKTFSVTFRGKSFDESRYIKQVSSSYGTDHTEFDLNDHADLADVIGELAYYSDEPSADAGAVPVWYLARMSRRDVTVALSGEGADELFGGYLTYKADRYNRYFSRLPRALRQAALGIARRIPPSDEKIGFEYKLIRFIEGSLLSSEAAHVFWNGSFSEEEGQRFFRYANAGPLASILAQMRPYRSSEEFLERFLDFDQRYSLPDALLYKVDRMSMAHAVEVRPPFLDDRIVAFAARLPERFKFAGFETKFALRRLMRDALPREVLRRPKIGFDIPIHEWFRGVLRPLLLETLSESAINQSGLFEWIEVRRIVDEHLDRKANRGYQLWGLVTLMLWMKRWNIEAPARVPLTISAASQAAGEKLVWEPAPHSPRTSEMPFD
ncbi:MAG TPA: asparagine synthase (glutamine-hydrolyzing) [Terracidiphilus sp.]|nr:asparagine synthase (glutamine-hydrolyzing) [Terracidiphilus sp.]